MKINVWVAISFSMLAAAATSVAQAEETQTSQETTTGTSPNAKDATVLVKALKIGKNPTFENAVPCYNTK